MATIFYWTTKGKPSARPIYGVHPNGDAAVPAEVAAVTVAGAPHEIAWPSAGTERTSAIDTTTTPPTIVRVLPTIPNGRAFRRALIGLVDGADLAAKLERADTLWENPKVAALMQQLDNEVLSETALALARKRWAKLKLAGIPSAGEVARVEAAAPGFGFTLAKDPG